jgi:hypothetical protein
LKNLVAAARDARGGGVGKKQRVFPERKRVVFVLHALLVGVLYAVVGAMMNVSE